MTDKNFLSPEDRRLAERLEALAQGLSPDASFERELEKKLMNTSSEPKTSGALAHALPALGWAGALVALALVLSWAIRTLIPHPPQPAAGGTPTVIPTGEASTPTPIPPSVTVYDWRGTPLTLNAPLPAAPAEASLYNYQMELGATLESARALAQQMGMNGAVYRVRGETTSFYDKDFLIVDGNARLYVRSDQYFQYYPDYPRYVAAINGGTPPANSEAVIEDFIQSHGFDFSHKILPSDSYGGYLAAPLTPDGRIICYEYFQCAGLHFQLDEQGILRVDGILPKYEAIGQYGIISAEAALQKILDANGGAGMLEGINSFGGVGQTWLRARPLDETITLYGWMTSIPSAEGGAPLVTLDGYTVTGNIEDIPSEYENTFIAATGQLREQDGVKTFALEKWEIYSNGENSRFGSISLQNGQVILNTDEGEIFVLPDASDLPLPLDNAFVIGVRLGDTFEWKSIDQRNVQGGGGGGGGGLGFYKLNLTGTPVPFPTPEAQMGGGGGGGSGEQTYTVQAGDTLTKIADQFGVTVEALMQANGLGDPSMLQVGQTLVIPGGETFLPQRVEGQRGTLSITIYKQADGSQRVEYNFLSGLTYPSLPLEGENLEALQAYQNRPVDVWGTVETNAEGQPVLKVERYEIPFPDLGFQILIGTQTPITLNGQPVTLFTTEDGKAYIQFNPGGGVDGAYVGNLDDKVQIEALIVPGESFGSYPALRIFAAQTTGNAELLQVTADQVYVVDLAAVGEFVPPSAAIERVELVYYMPDPRYIPGGLEPDQRYLQPAWLFAGHYSDGSEFFILVQALKQGFLLPEIAPYTQPG